MTAKTDGPRIRRPRGEAPWWVKRPDTTHLIHAFSRLAFAIIWQVAAAEGLT